MTMPRFCEACRMMLEPDVWGRIHRLRRFCNPCGDERARTSARIAARRKRRGLPLRGPRKGNLPMRDCGRCEKRPRERGQAYCGDCLDWINGYRNHAD